ncbi:MAG: TAT-variant-translocated molybdopterin oxidoreductase [Acidobacteriota bacterium]|jgi:molybdopterin-containing oxidoreductase family iron-sulfur binding subunit
MNRFKILSQAGERAPAERPALELSEVRERLEGLRGRRYWKSLEELADTPGFREMLEREFPRHAPEWEDGLSRRRFLQLSSASLALAGLTGCTRQPLESIVPYVEQPEQVVPGEPLYFATAHAMGGYAQGVLAESHTGRPTKIEGNPDHPANPSGGTDLFAQASVLQLYDPDRSGTLTYLNQIRTWNDFKRDLRPRVQALRSLQGDGLRILTGTVTSPSLAEQIRSLLRELPDARWHQYEPAARHEAEAGARRAFGEPLEVRYELADADVIVALDSDFLTQGPGAVRNAHQWAERRRAGSGAGAPSAPSGNAEADPSAMNRLYAVESSPSNTGSVADHRLALAPSRIGAFALALAAELGVPDIDAADAADLPDEARRWLPAVAEDLRSHPGRSLVVAGDGAPAAVHVLAHAMNEVLGAVGSTVVYTDPVVAEPVDQVASLRELVTDLEAGAVDTLLILGTNPVFDAPADLGFVDALTRAKLRVHLGLFKDETAEYCQWHLPMTHYLESWGDARSIDGTVSLIQPLIEPLYRGHTPHEVLAQLADRPDATTYQIVRDHWRQRLGGDFERAWRRALHDGFVEGTALEPRQDGVRLAAGAVAEAAHEVRALPGSGSGADGLEVALRPDPTVWDGSFANNAWLQELPKTATRITWDNAVLMSPATGEELGVHGIEPELVHERPMVTVTVDGRSVEMPAWVVPGHADGVVTLHFGYGRRRAGKVAEGTGFDVYPLRTAGGMSLARGTVEPTGRRHPVATTQDHHSMEGRHLVRTGTVGEYRENPHFVEEMGHEDVDASFYPGFEYDGHAWGMAVDLNACTGCNACVVACQSENNIPVVGKEQVMKGREMHWIRIDRYFEGDDAHGVSAFHHQPVLCMHCEQAPCEPVCPVGATVHSDEGLNDMVYNRCVGTRYCSNNCPYKVRRFNFLKYTDHTVEVEKMVRNPDVTVRARGVMEKCTYCTQRISQARIKAKVDGQRGRGDGTIRDGAVRTACQQACPSNALIFGDINDPSSEVARRKAEPLDYGLLEQLGTRPRTTYLAKLRNPNPRLEPAVTTGRTEHGSHG